MTVKLFLGAFVYRTIGSLLPTSNLLFLGRLGKIVRAWCGKLMLTKCGNNVDISPHAFFSSKVQLGNNSGIGANAHVNGKCIIGDNVMMGPNVIIYTRNHRHERIDIPMREQGVTEEKVVIIGDDVWIGSNVIILPGVKIGGGVSLVQVL